MVEMHCMKSLAARTVLLCIAHCAFFTAFVEAQEQSKLVEPGNIQGCHERTLSAWRPNALYRQCSNFLGAYYPVNVSRVLAYRAEK